METTPSTRSRVSRRGFIKGVVAGGATAYSAGYLFRQNGTVSAQQPAQGTAERLVTLRVNGQDRRVDILPQETLAMTLRYKLGLTGTKLGCDRGECGACTVIVGGRSQYSCSTLTHQAVGAEITTIEGLASSDGTLHPVQQAVLDETGFQCAFCSPGFIMSMVAMIDKNPNPSRAEAAHALSGNLCRCGDYDKILTSALRAAEYSRRA